MKFFKFLIPAVLLFSVFSQSANAVPAFARQMNTECTTCHYQHFPLLNAFGRAFKTSGYTISSTPAIGDGDSFALPSNLNLGMITNVRYQKSNGSRGDVRSSNDGEFIAPGETSLFLGGQVAPNVGALIEGDVGAGGIGGGGFLASLKLVGTKDIHGMTLGGVLFAAGLGPSYMFETLNTGAVGNHVMNLALPIEVSALQYVQTTGNANGDIDNAAEGIGAYLVGDNFYLAAAKWSPNHSPVDANGAGAAPSSLYLRAVLTHDVGNLDGAIGMQIYGGSSDVVQEDSSLVHYNTNMYALDAQLQGVIGGKETGIYLGFSAAPPTTGVVENLYNPEAHTKMAGSIAMDRAITDHTSMQLAYRVAHTGDVSANDDIAITVGLSYMPYPNVQLSLADSVFAGAAHDGGAGAIDASGSGKNLLTANILVGF